MPDNDLTNTIFKDDVEVKFGDSGDFKLKYDSGDSRLEILDAANNVLGHIVDDGATGTLTWLGTLALSSGAITTGSGTSTMTAVTNVAASSQGEHIYARIGNMVIVGGRIGVTPTSGSTATEIEATLPISSNLTTTNCFGAGQWMRGTNYGPVRVTSDATNDRLEFKFTTDASTSEHFLTYIAIYTVA